MARAAELIARSIRAILLFLVALLLCALIRIALSMMSYQAVYRWVPKRNLRPPHPALCLRTARAVTRAARFVPRATCLTQAFAAQIMLGMRGFTSSIEIGVRTEDGQFGAHAWLVNHQGAIILGGTPDDLATFRRLTSLRAG
jgi:hypothetical protein